MSIDVAVIGGGISGLATAYGLMRRGQRVVVLERQVRAGGNAVSERIGGFLMEHGPSSVNASIEAAVALSHELGLEKDGCDLGPGVRWRYLVGDGALHRISIHPLGFLTSGYLSPRARLRLVAEALVPARCAGDEETVAEFFARRFGPEFCERIADPLVGGLFAGNAEELSMAATFPALARMERRYGSITRPVLAGWRAGHKMPGRRLFSWRDGIGALPRALAGRLGRALRTGVAVRRIKASGGRFRIEAGAAGAFEARAVVVATQSHVAAALLEGLDREGAEGAGTIDAPPLSVVFLGYRREQVAHPLDGLGYLTPRREDRALTGAQFCSTMFPGRAPEGHVAVAGYIGGARAPELAQLPAADLVALAREEFGDLLGARGEPVIARLRQWPRGLPQYRPGHGERVAPLRAIAQRRPGLFVTGNYFAGPSVASCLAQARYTVIGVERYLRDHTAPAGYAEGSQGTAWCRDGAAKA